MTVDFEPKRRTDPDVDNLPTFDQLPPPGYEEIRAREIASLLEEHNMTPEDLERYEKMVDQDQD